MSKLNTENYFDDVSKISNSQLRNFVSYNKYGNRLLTPEIYSAYKRKLVEFDCSDAVIIGKMVDKYFDKTDPLYLDEDRLFEMYVPVSRRSSKKEYPEGVIEITTGMADTFKKMVTWADSFEKFIDILKKDDTECQKILEETIEITKSDGEIVELEMKGLPDIINEKEKLIVDLKTTGNMQMIVDELQFKGIPIFTANYIRQCAIYNKLAGGDYNAALALVTEKGVLWIDIPNIILQKAWEQIELDLVDLHTYINNPKELENSIFDLTKIDNKIDELSL